MKFSTSYDTDFKEKVEKLIVMAESLNRGESIYNNVNTLLGALISAYHEEFLEDTLFGE